MLLLAFRSGLSLQLGWPVPVYFHDFVSVLTLNDDHIALCGKVLVGALKSAAAPFFGTCTRWVQLVSKALFLWFSPHPHPICGLEMAF